MTTAPNLGKVFNGTARPASPEDIEILAPSDWVKRQEHPWCYQFRKWDSDKAICTWEDDEFFIPRHLLMVVEVLEGQACEKFFRSLEKRNLKQTEISTDYSQLKVGDRLIHHSTNSKGIHTHFATVIAVAKGKVTFEREHNNCCDTFSYKELKEAGYSKYLQALTRESTKPRVYIVDQSGSLAIITDNLGFGFVVDWLGFGKVPNPPSGRQITYNWERDSETISKFAIAPSELVTKFLAQNEPLEFKIGDRVVAYKGKKASASAVVHDARIENGRIQIIWDDVPDGLPRPFAVDSLSLEIETPSEVSKPVLPLVEKSPWDISPQEWESQGIKCRYDGMCVYWGTVPGSIPGLPGCLRIEATDRLENTYINPRTLINFVEDSWDTIRQILHLLKQPKTKTEILRSLHIKQKLIAQALDVGIDIGLIHKDGKLYKTLVAAPYLYPEPPEPNSQYEKDTELEKFFTSEIQVGDRFAFPDSDNHIVVIKINPRTYRLKWGLGGKRTVYQDKFRQAIIDLKLTRIESCSRQDTSSVEAAAIQKEQLPQDINPSGQLKTTPTPQPSTESDSQELGSSSKTSEPLQATLFSDSQHQISQFSVHLVQTFPWLVSEMGLLEFADNCFLKDSDFFDSNAQVHLCLKTLMDSLAQTKQLPSRKSSKRLQVWGIAAPGNLGMATGTPPKTENGFSSWAITAEVKATQPKPTKKSLQEIFNNTPVNSFTGEELEEAYTLRASTAKLGAGNKSHPNTFVSIPVKVYADGVEAALESPALCSGGWQHRSPLHQDKRGASFAVLYRAADGDRIYTDQAPCLRSQKDAGTGAYKIREYVEGRRQTADGRSLDLAFVLKILESAKEQVKIPTAFCLLPPALYFERPINATEAEQLMGWEVGSTAIGINQEGDEITISQTQRIKMLGNGIIPAEIADILTSIKPILERKLESEVSENLRFAYRQLRQQGMNHHQAMSLLPD